MAKTNRVNTKLPIVSANCFRVQLFGTMFNRPVSMGFFFLPDPANPPPNTVADVGASFWPNWIRTKMLAAQSQDFSAHLVKAEDLTLPGQLPFENSLNPAANQGAIAQPGDPNLIAAGLQRITSTRGQHGRGRILLGGLPNNATLQDGFTAAYLLLLDALAINIAQPMNSVAVGRYLPALARVTFEGGPPPIRTVRAQPLSTCNVNLRTSSCQRRRPKMTP